MAAHPFTGTLSVTDKIGIGINDPLTQLHILSSTTAPSQAYLESGGALLKLSVDAGGASIGTANAFPLSIQTDGTSRIAINSTGDITTTGALTVQNNLLINGNVGIGTSTAPTAKLEVNGTVKVNSLQIGTLTVQSVSSGTPPSNTLQVNGGVKATSFQGNGATLEGVVKKAGDTITGLLNIQNNLTVTNNIGVGTSTPVAPLQIVGGNWNPNDTEGDIRLGDGTYKFKIGIARGGGGAGDVRLRAQGGTNRMMIGGGTSDALWIQNNEVSIPSGKLSFGSQVRQMLNLWSQEYAIGVQNGTQYFRSHSDFCWFRGGVHHDGQNNPGGGARLMAVNFWGDLILSGRTNPEAAPTKSLCRAMVDLGNKLTINHGNDFPLGVEIFNGRFVSSRAYKKNIVNLSTEEATLALEDLNPVKFSYKNDRQNQLHLGFIAEDVPDLLSAADKGSIGSLDIVAVLTKVVQEQQTTISTLAKKVKFLEAKSR